MDYKRCKYCNQSNENRLTLSSRLVDGKVIHEWVCLDCLFVDIFQAVREYGNLLRFEEGIFEESYIAESRERFNSRREGRFI